MIRRGFVAIVLCLVAHSTSATSIVIVRAPTGILFAADSKLTKGDHASSGTICKLGIAGNVIWGGAGILDETVTRFNVRRLMTGVLSMGGSFSFKIKTAEAAIDQGLGRVLNALKRGDHDYYIRSYEDITALEISFATFDNGIPRVSVRDFQGSSDPNTGEVSVSVVSSKESPSPEYPNISYFTLGAHETIDAEISKAPSIWNRMGLIGAARYLVETEIAAIPDDVGPPIAILQLTGDGSHWIDKGVCP